MKQKILEDYILENFSKGLDDSKISILNTVSDDVSIVKINENGYNTYVTKGLSEYKMPERSKDYQYIEIVVRASETISKEDETFLIKKFSSILPLYDNGVLGEFHTFALTGKEEDTCLPFRWCLCLQAAKPFKKSGKVINFLLLLLINEQERAWLCDYASWWARNLYNIDAIYTASFLEIYKNEVPEKDWFLVDKNRKSLFKNLPNARERDLKRINRGASLKATREFASMPWIHIRSGFNSEELVSDSARDWKYIEHSTRIYLEEYIGEARRIRVPAAINGKPVWGCGNAFSTKTKSISRKKREVRLLIEEVDFADTIEYIYGFEDNGCLKDVHFPKKISSFDTFTKSHEMKITEYGGGTYVEIEGNPYYLLIAIHEKTIRIHQDIKLIDRDCFEHIYSKIEFIVPDNVKKMQMLFQWAKDYDVREQCIIVSGNDSPATNYALRNGFPVSSQNDKCLI